MFSTIGYYICIPFAWLVRFFYELTSSYGAAIILFTLVIKLIMLPFQMKSKKSMLRMNRMSGKIQEIQKKYANNQLKMQEEMQKFYQEEGFNPMSGCLWSFLPLPILIALYSIIRQPITHFMMLGEDVLHNLIDAAYNAGINMANIVQLAEDGTMALSSAGLPQLQPYGQINLVNAIQTQLPDAVSGIDGWVNLNYSFLNLNLSTNPWDVVKDFSFSWACIGLILIPILAGGSQLLMSYISMKQQPQQGAAAGSTKMMMYTMPLFSVYIAFIMPAALGVYWIAQSVFSLVQEIIMNKFFTKKKPLAMRPGRLTGKNAWKRAGGSRRSSAVRLRKSRLYGKSRRLPRLPRPPKPPRPRSAPQRPAGLETGPMQEGGPTSLTAMRKVSKEPL